MTFCCHENIEFANMFINESTYKKNRPCNL